MSRAPETTPAASARARSTDAPLEAAGRALRRGDFAAAEELARAALESGGGREARYLLAVACRYQGRHREALEELDALQRQDPGYGRLYQERGHNWLALDEPFRALAAFRDATARNPALLASWKALGPLTAARPEWQDLAREAAIQVRALSQLPVEILSARSMLHEGRLERAETLCRHYLQRNPQQVEGMRLLAAIASQHGQLEEAEFLLDSAVEFYPDNLLARLDRVNVLYRQQKFSRALAEAEALDQRLPGNRSIRATLANQYIAVGRFEDGIALLRALLAEHPDDPAMQLTLGHALKTTGETAKAVEAYRAASAIRPDFGDAWWSLANLKTFRFSADDLAQMREREADENTALEDRIHLCFALGKALEDAGDYASSFDCYQRGNRLRRGTLRYDAARMSQRLARQRAFFSADFLRGRPASGCEAPDPIFIVGMPRAGSTLLEQILSAHSAIDGTMELNHIPALAQRLDGHGTRAPGEGYPERLQGLGSDTLRKLGEQFLEEASVHRQGAAFFIDKMPNNFRHIGLIHLILPRARIIDARRDAMACCFSNFKQLFASGQEFSYDQAELGRYYREYVELMEHWDAVLPGKVLRVQHEDLLADLEGQVRRMLDFLGLPFETQCLEYHRSERAVRTPSSEQVRQPLFRSAVDQWRHYAPWLAPLREALGQSLAPPAGP